MAGISMAPCGPSRVRPFRVRTDLSATLFLADPEAYDGGELVIGDEGDEKQVKLPAGDLVLYSGGTVHRVMPVTRGARLAAFFWVQSMVRDEIQRGILFDFDNALQQPRSYRSRSRRLRTLGGGLSQSSPPVG